LPVTAETNAPLLEATNRAAEPVLPAPDAATPNLERSLLSALGMAQAISPPLLSLAVFVLVGGALAMLRIGSPILNPIILSVYIVTLTLPIYRRLKRSGMNPAFVLPLIVLLVLVIGLGLNLLAWLSVTRLIQGLGGYTNVIQDAVNAVALQAGLGADGETGRAAARLMASIVLSIAPALTSIVFSLILSAFLLIEAPRFGRLLNTSMKDLPFIGLTPEVMNAAVTYLFVRLRINTLTGLITGLLFWLIGIPFAPLWGLLMGVMSFVPYIGMVVATIPVVLLALAGSGPTMAIGVVVGITLLNFAIENVVAPSLTGKSLSLSPAVVILSFAFWIWLLGAIGAIVAMPITVLLMLTCQRYESTRWVSQLIGTTDI
jgi:AI-2 transport protein TqsA